MNSIEIWAHSAAVRLPVLDVFDPISLAEMDSVKLLDRMDIKFMFHRDHLRDILNRSYTDYMVLCIAGSRFSRYETRYFDTKNLEMYTQHHNGKLNRHKVRIRDYVDSGISFFEIKFKTNKGRTIKDRVKLSDHKHIIEGESTILLSKKTGYHAEMLHEAIQVNYNRITLVRKNLSERLTIDFGMVYKLKRQSFSFPELIIAEVKQDRASKSPFIDLMQAEHIHPLSMSKYCLGIASLNQDVKINRFKPNLITINKLCHEFS